MGPVTNVRSSGQRRISRRDYWGPSDYRNDGVRLTRAERRELPKIGANGCPQGYSIARHVAIDRFIPPEIKDVEGVLKTGSVAAQIYLDVPATDYFKPVNPQDNAAQYSKDQRRYHSRTGFAFHHDGAFVLTRPAPRWGLFG